MEKWAAQELAQTDLGDERRNKRLIRIVEDLSAQPDSSVLQASGGVAATKSAYNLWKSPYFQANLIFSAGPLEATQIGKLILSTDASIPSTLSSSRSNASAVRTRS